MGHFCCNFAINKPSGPRDWWERSESVYCFAYKLRCKDWHDYYHIEFWGFDIT